MVVMLACVVLPQATILLTPFAPLNCSATSMSADPYSLTAYTTLDVATALDLFKVSRQASIRSWAFDLFSVEKRAGIGLAWCGGWAPQGGA